MPLYKPRTKPPHLVILDILIKRMNLSSKSHIDYTNWLKGFEGEKRFDQFIEPLAQEAYILHDLLLKKQNTTFQIDTLMITSEKIYLFEIKNYEGEHLFEDNKFYRLPNTEILNPLHQLQRAESLLKQLLKSKGHLLPVEGYVIFTHPHFTLYQAPLEPPLVFPTQVEYFLEQMKLSSRVTTPSEKLAKDLTDLHISQSPLPDLPHYTFDSLQKGVYCLQCFSFTVYMKGHSCHCKSCGASETLNDAVLRSVKEFKTLFPNEKIKTRTIYEWCRKLGSKKRIRTVLQKHFTMKKLNKWTYFE